MKKALDKRQLWREIEREEKKTNRKKLADLRLAIREARVERRTATERARAACREIRFALRERVRQMREKARDELREAVRLEKEAANARREKLMGEARKLDLIERRQEEFKIEADHQTEMRRLEKNHVKRRREHPHASYLERRGESDDEVRQNVPAELHPLFERVKRGIRATPRMSRSEAMMKYAEEHPSEVLLVLEDKTDALVRELEAREREAARALRAPKERAPKLRAPKGSVQKARPRYTPEQLAEVPF